MNNKLIVSILLISALLMSCSEKEEKSNKSLEKKVNVEVQKIEPQTFERFIQLVGTVRSDDDVQISAEVSGRVERFYVQKGAKIKKGAPILKIDDSKLKQEKNRLKAQTRQAKEQYQRLKTVFEQDSIGSKIDVINAKAAYEAQKSALHSVEVDLNNTTVRAPFNATLDEKLIDVGEMASPGAPMVRLIGNGNLKVSAGVPARFSDAVSEGDSAKIWFDYENSDTLRLPLSFVGQSIDKQARTFKVETDLPGKTHSYKVDMIANISLNVFKLDSSIVVSEEYIFQKNKGTVAYTAGKDSSGEMIAIEHILNLGPAYENNVVVSKGLSKGDQLITVGSSFLEDSVRIKVVENKENELAEQH